MKTTDNQTSQQMICYAALLGIDWGDKNHFWAMEDVESGKRSRGKLEQTPEAVEVFVAGLIQRYPGGKIAVAVEQSRGALVGMLSKYEALDVYPVHPNTAAQYRQMFRPSGGKNDKRDGDSLLDLLSKHPEQLRKLEPDTVGTRQLQQLVEQRRCLVDEKTRHNNRLKDQLKIYYPQMLKWWPNVDTEVVTEWLERWPTVEEAQKERPGNLRKFLKQHRYGAAEIESRVAAIAQAVPALKDKAIVEPAVMYVQALTQMMRVLRQQIRLFDEAIEPLFQQHELFAIIDSLPGAGAALGPRLAAALGTQRERFPKALDLQCYTGIAPVTRQSGNTKVVSFRWACPKFLRQTFHEWASHTMSGSAWARAYYDELIGHGKKHHAAVRALAFKWQRILFRCWKDGVPYDEAKYMAARAQRLNNALPTLKTL